MFHQHIRNEKIYKPRRPNPSDTDFIKLFRFTPENVMWLSQHFLQENRETRGGALDNHMKMKTFLRYVADPGK